MPEPQPPQEGLADTTLAEFIDAHSENTGMGTATWTYRFHAKGHDVLFLIASGPESVALITAAAAAAGLDAGVNEVLH